MKAGKKRLAKYFKYFEKATKSPQYAHICLNPHISNTLFLFPSIISI